MWSAQLEAEMREMREEDAAVKIQARHRGAAARRAAQPEAAVAEAAPASSEGSGSEDADRLSSSSGTEGERGVPEAAAAAAEQVLSLSDYASLFLFMWSFVWGVVWEGTCNKVLSSDLAAEASAVERASAAHARELAAAAAEVAAAEAEMAALQAEVGIGHGRVVAVHHPLTLSIPDLRIHSVPLCLKRRYDRNPRSTSWPPQRSRQCTAARRRGGAGARPGGSHHPRLCLMISSPLIAWWAVWRAAREAVWHGARIETEKIQYSLHPRTFRRRARGRLAGFHLAGLLEEDSCGRAPC